MPPVSLLFSLFLVAASPLLTMNAEFSVDPVFTTAQMWIQVKQAVFLRNVCFQQKT